MSEVKLSEAQAEFLRDAASEVANGNCGLSAASYGPTTQALLKRGLIEKARQPLHRLQPRWRPTAAGYAAIGRDDQHA